MSQSLASLHGSLATALEDTFGVGGSLSLDLEVYDHVPQQITSTPCFVVRLAEVIYDDMNAGERATYEVYFFYPASWVDGGSDQLGNYVDVYLSASGTHSVSSILNDGGGTYASVRTVRATGPDSVEIGGTQLQFVRWEVEALTN